MDIHAPGNEEVLKAYDELQARTSQAEWIARNLNNPDSIVEGELEGLLSLNAEIVDKVTTAAFRVQETMSDRYQALARRQRA